MKRIAALAGIIGVTLTMGIFSAVHSNAQNVPGPNPWNFTLTDGSKDGIVVNGKAGSLSQIFTVKDPYGAPVFSVGHVGGAAVYGDRFAVFPPNSVTQPVIVLGDDGRISISGPNSGVWIDGQLLTPADIAWIHSHE